MDRGENYRRQEIGLDKESLGDGLVEEVQVVEFKEINFYFRFW